MSECEHVLMIIGVGLEADYCNACGLPDHAIKIAQQAATIERQQAVIDAAKIVDGIPDDDWPIEDIDMPILEKLDALHDALEPTNQARMYEKKARIEFERQESMKALRREFNDLIGWTAKIESEFATADSSYKRIEVADERLKAKSALYDFIEQHVELKL